MVRAQQRRPRGQAMVETVLGILVFITILMFGIHFAEVGYLSLKVQEASTSALWDTTSAQMHTLGAPSQFGSLTNAITSAGGSATNRYRDFDGRTSKSGGTAPVQVFTSAGGLTVDCDPENSISFKPSTRSMNQVVKDTGGMSCSSKAMLSPTPRLLKNFLDQGEGGFFNVAQIAGSGIITVCGTGRARGGQCSGRFGILLDDWGLEGQDEASNCKVLAGSGCGNKDYYNAAQKIFQLHNPVVGAARAFALAIVDSAPANPSQFYMSFVGEEDNFQDRENGGDQDPNNGRWVTSPGRGSPTQEYDTAYGSREQCFLGKCPL